MIGLTPPLAAVAALAICACDWEPWRRSRKSDAFPLALISYEEESLVFDDRSA